MSKQILSEEFKRMQKLAGIITETQYKEKKNLIENQALDTNKFKKEATDFIKKHMNTVKDAVKFYENKPDDYEESLIQTIYDFFTNELGNDWGWTTHNTGSEEENTYVNGWTDEKDEIFTGILRSFIK